MKITKTYSIEKDVFELFDIICKRKNINKSSIIEKSINDFISKNSKKINFRLKEDESVIVNIEKMEDGFYISNDGSKYPSEIFHKIFKIADIDNEYNINVNEFFNNDGLIKIVNKLKNIDENESINTSNEPLLVPGNNENNLDNLCLTKLKVNFNVLTLLDLIRYRASSKEMRNKIIKKLSNMIIKDNLELTDNDEILGMISRLKELNDNDNIDISDISKEISRKKEHDKKIETLIDDIKEKIKKSDD